MLKGGYGVGLGLRLETDFDDYYDSLFDDSGPLVYKRMAKDSMPRGKAINYLKGYGVPTLNPMSAGQFSRTHDKLVIYTNPKLHGGLGKIIETRSQAELMYGNSLAVPFIPGISDYLKFIQIGSRRFHIIMHTCDDGIHCNPGKPSSITEINPSLNYDIAIPIFSIDYIPVNNRMVAIDFNEVQHLGSLGFNRILCPDDVVAEIEKATVAYRIH